jgi:hypothetical protein
MWRHNRLDAQLQVRDCSVSEPKTEYIGNINHPQRLNSQATGYAGENLKGSTDTAKACFMGVNLIDAGGL